MKTSQNDQKHSRDFYKNLQRFKYLKNPSAILAEPMEDPRLDMQIPPSEKCYAVSLIH